MRSLDELRADMDSADEALSIALETGDKDAEGDAWRSLSTLYEECDDLDQALEAARKERLCREKANNKGLAVQALQKIAKIHLAREELKSAARAAEAANTICKKTKDPTGQINSLALVAQAHMMTVSKIDEESDHKGPLEERQMSEAASKAYRAATEAMEVVKPLKDDLSKAVANMCNAEVLSLVGQTRESVTSALVASECYRKLGDEHSAACALLICARGYQEMKAPGLVEKNAEKALELFKKCEDAEGQVAAIKVLDGIGPKGGMIASGSYIPDAAGPAAPTVQAQSIADVPKAGPDPVQVKETIRREVELILGSADDVHDDTPLMDTGLDSLSSVQFRNDLTRDFNVKLPASLMFDYPTIGALTEKIIESIKDQS